MLTPLISNVPTVFRGPLQARMFEVNDKTDAARVLTARLGETEDLPGPLLILCSRASDSHTRCGGCAAE